MGEKFVGGELNSANLYIFFLQFCRAKLANVQQMQRGLKLNAKTILLMGKIFHLIEERSSSNYKQKKNHN